MTEENPTDVVHVRRALASHDSTEAWGTISWLTDRARHGVAATVGYVEIRPGEANPLHVHANCSEILVLLEGRLSHVVGEEVVELEPHDLLVVPSGRPHRAENVGPSTARMIVVYDDGSRSFEAVD